MQRLQPKETCCRACGSGGSFCLPRDSWGVVRESVVGPFGHVCGLDSDVLLHNDAGQFQITVSDVAFWIGKRDEIVGDGAAEGASPEQSSRALVVVGKEQHAPHSSSRCVTSPKHLWLAAGN